MAFSKPNPKTNPNMKKKTQDLNMSREYRDELKTLRRHRRKVVTDYKTAQRGYAKDLRALNRAMKRCDKMVEKALAGIDRRIGILEGRLS